MWRDGESGANGPVPGRWMPAPEAAERRYDAAVTEVVRDGKRWSLGSPADVAWIVEATSDDKTITTAIPSVFNAYATIVLPWDRDDQERHDQTLLSVLRAYSREGQPWWLGYLDTGADDVVFPAVPRVSLYWQWPYVLVQAGPEQAATWRRWDGGSFWAGRLPNLMFPEDRSWLVTTLWDDDWTCIGGPVALVEALLAHPDLGSSARRVEPGDDRTPPGHQAN